MNCFCNNNVKYQHCCGRFIDNNEEPNTAEELMRSRYSAYAQAKIEYIQKTMTGPSIVGFNLNNAKKLAQTSDFLGLQVLRSFSHGLPNQAFVEFIATIKSQDGNEHHLHEVSEFQFIGDCWFYYDGKIIAEA